MNVTGNYFYGLELLIKIFLINVFNSNLNFNERSYSDWKIKSPFIIINIVVDPNARNYFLWFHSCKIMHKYQSNYIVNYSK